LGEEKRFYTVWVIKGPEGLEIPLPLHLQERTCP
jgi:hypothetical protein